MAPIIRNLKSLLFVMLRPLIQTITIKESRFAPRPALPLLKNESLSGPAVDPVDGKYLVSQRPLHGSQRFSRFQRNGMNRTTAFRGIQTRRVASIPRNDSRGRNKCNVLHDAKAARPARK